MTKWIVAGACSLVLLGAGVASLPVFSKSEARKLGRALDAERSPIGAWVPRTATYKWCGANAPVGHWGECVYTVFKRTPVRCVTP